MTAKALAESAQLDADTITRLERGRNAPGAENLAKLAQALSYPISFFEGEGLEQVDVGAVSFRSFSKMTAKEKGAALAAGSLGLMLNEWVEARFGLSEPDLLDLSRETDAEVAAIRLRQHWGLGEQPISDLLGLLESRGVRLFSLSENTASVNAFSFWRGDRPFVYLNNFKTAESSRFDAAHELGHLVMHKHGDPKEKQGCEREDDHSIKEVKNSEREIDRSTKEEKGYEREADRFASAFLMPENDVRSRMPHVITVDFIIRAKMRWRVSAMAMARRMRDLGALSDWQYKSACIELGRRGYRSGEPVGVERESSHVWRKILTYLWQDRITKEDIARELHLPLDELEGLIWSLTSQNGRRAPPTGAAGSLRKV